MANRSRLGRACPSWSIQARPARGAVKSSLAQRDPDVLSAFLEDAAHYPGGHADAVVAATSEADIAETLGVRVTWCGFQNQHAMPGLLAAADCLVLPSRSESWCAMRSASQRRYPVRSRAHAT